MEEWAVKGRKLNLVEGNIALLDVDAIVNAANKSLILGSGVAGAIRTHGGPSIQEECDRIGPISSGEAVITRAGDLKSQYVIHAAGPVYGEGDEDKKLADATLNSLIIAHQKKLKDIAFPAISTGVFRFPLQKCSEIMLKTAMDFLEENSYPREIIFCLYGETAFSAFKNTLEKFAAARRDPVSSR